MASWVAACGLDDVDPEDVIPFEHDGQDYAIYRSPDDEYYATDGHCTHEKTLLCDGLVMGRVIECPKHNGRFDYVSGKARVAGARGRAHVSGQGRGRNGLRRGRRYPRGAVILVG